MNSYGWPWFRENVGKAVQANEALCFDLLEFVDEMDSVVGGILDRPMSPLGERPQDYVVSILISRSFRLTISALQLSLSGYADSTRNLMRTVWETGIRLLDMRRNPAAAAFGFLLDGVAVEIGHLQTAQDMRESQGEAIGMIPTNLEVLQSYQDNLRAATRNLGFDSEEVRRKHGKLNYRAVCKDFGIEQAYLVNYAFDSTFTHEKGAATWNYLVETDEERQFHLGPVTAPGEPRASVADTLYDMARALVIACQVVGPEHLIGRSERLAQKIADLDAHS